MALGNGGNSLLTAGSNKLIQTWRLPEGVLLRELAGHKDTITLLAASIHGQLAASYSRDRTILVWNDVTGMQIGKINCGETILTTLLIHPNEQMLIAADADGGLHVWNISTTQRVLFVPGNGTLIRSMVVSPDGFDLYTLGSDGKITAYELDLLLLISLPIENTASPMLQMIQKRRQKLPPSARQWLDYITRMLRWKHRFDIELETAAAIQAGEFDIEL
jgi:WD40 repeat protein